MNDKDMLYKCLECGNQEIALASDYRKDGRVCESCGGHLSPIGYIGIDLATGTDRTIYPRS